MLGIPRRFAHVVFGVIQSGLTSAVAAAIASYPFFAQGGFLGHWLRAWLIAWALMLPVVIFAAPFIRKLALALTREDESALT
jgi:FtsH-binding integral membrane protein